MLSTILASRSASADLVGSDEQTPVSQTYINSVIDKNDPSLLTSARPGRYYMPHRKSNADVEQNRATRQG